MRSAMPALVNFAAAPHSVELREVARPEIGPRDVLLQVRAVSVCGSDLHQWLGGASWKVNYPVVLGHEFGGVIAQTGREVRGFAEGDRVVSETAAVIDEQSPLSRQGLYNLDPNRLGFGYGVDGAMTEFVKVPARCLHRIPDGLPFEKAALTEPCCVAYNAVCVNGRVQVGDTVLVLGPGPIGLLCAVMAKLAGARHLIIAGMPADAKRLAVAKQLGADTIVTGDPLPAVRELGDGLGVDVVIDAAGVSATLQTAMQAVRPGGQILKVGWGPQPLNFSLDPLVLKAVRLHGSFSHNWPVWERVIEMIAAGQINLDPVISRVGTLGDWHECFEKMHTGEYVKAVLKPNG
jgi:alcohol dehydrogenase/L-iditol 2-dehydrogenase